MYFYRIQYVRHLHDKVQTVHERTAPKKEDNSADAAAAAAAAMGNGGLMGFNDTLMIGDGSGYGVPPPGAYDPYSAAYGGGYGGYDPSMGAGAAPGGYGAPMGGYGGYY